MRYTVTEREILRIVETLKEFRTISLGQKLRIYTNHKQITCKFFITDRVLRKRLILKEYGKDTEYTKNENNIVAYILSRTPLYGNGETTQKSTFLQEIVSEINDIKEIPEDNFPINLKLIKKYQRLEPIIKAKYTAGT